MDELAFLPICLKPHTTPYLGSERERDPSLIQSLFDRVQTFLADCATSLGFDAFDRHRRHASGLR